MKPFSLVVPDTLAAAGTAAQAKDTVLKAAGIDLLDRLKERIDTPANVVNLLPLAKDLGAIAAEGAGLRLGALATLVQVAEAPALAAPAFGALRLAAAATATPLVRNRATVGGNLLQLCRCWYLRSAAFGCLHGGKGPACLAMTGENRYHAVLGWHDCVRVHPSNLAPALLALGAEYSTHLRGAERRRPLAELFPAEPTAEKAEHTLQPGEILTAVHLPPPPAGSRSSYRESREKLSFDWATTAAAVRLTLQDGVVGAADIVLGAVAPVPLPVPAAARLLVGQRPDAALFAKVADAAFADATPLAQNAYKLTVGKAVLTEALLDCAR